MPNIVVRRSSRGGAVSSVPMWLLLGPVLVTAFLWATRVNEVTGAGVLYAFLLLLIPWVSFMGWQRQGRWGLPVFALVGSVYWVWFAIGYFWLERTPRIYYGSIDSQTIEQALWLAVVGVVCLGLGMRIQLPVLKPGHQLELVDRPSSWSHVQLILVAGTIAGAFPASRSLLGAEGRQVMEILISTVPTAALILLLGKCLQGRGSRLDRALLWMYFPFRIVAGIASGWMGATVNVAVMCGAVYLIVRRKVPWAMLAICAPIVLFLQVGKQEFRNRYWNQGTDGGIIEKASFWLSGSASLWSESINSGGGSASQLSAESLARTSLLPQVSHVLDVTPSQVPFQDGQTYSYMAVTLIPRFLWPGKPSVNDANRYYQVAFGLTRPQDVDNVNIGAGCLAEAYINFGWPGVIGIMLFIGVVLGVYQRAFLSKDSSALFLAIGLALLPAVLGIESQMAAYLGGVIQHVLLTILIFLPAVRSKQGRGVNFRKGYRLASAPGSG